MGQKVNPKSLRVGVTEGWPVRWFFSSLSAAGQEKGRSYFGGKSVNISLEDQDNYQYMAENLFRPKQ